MNKKLLNKDIYKVFLRSNLLQGSWNFERMQSLGFCYTIIPIINRLYSENNKDRKKAIKRHLEFFNTHPYVSGPILGIVMAMEEKLVNNASINNKTINNIKVGLMGPLASVGDPIFWGTMRPIFAALGSDFAIHGSILGPSLFFLLFNKVRLLVRYLGISYGYLKGLKVIDDVDSNFLKKIIEGSSILGLFVMGALVNRWTHINIPIKVSEFIDHGKITIITVQTICDQLIPGLIPLLLTFLCMYLLRYGISSILIIISFFLVSILGYSVGLLSL